MGASGRRGRALWDCTWLLAAILAGSAAMAAEQPATTRATSAATQPSDPDLVGWWRADAGSEAELVDLSGHRRVAKPIGAKVVIEKPGGRAAIRVNESTRELNAGIDADFDFTADFTVAVRAKLAADTGPVIILSKRAAGATEGWAVVHGLQGTGGIAFLAAPRVAMPTPCKAVDDWVHVAVTFHEGQFLLYVDGKAIGVMEWPSVPLPATKQPLVIGSGTDGKAIMDGWVDDVRIYHRGLTAAEVEALAGGKEPASPYVALTAAEDKLAREWARDLGANSYDRREKAAENLRGMGRKAFPLLREYRDSDDPEVSSRVKALLGELPRVDGGQP